MILDRFSLRGKVAIVTGSGRGIGKGIALVFGEAGADLVCAARTASEIEATAAELRSMGGRALAVGCDVRDADQVDTMVRRTLEEFGRVDVLVNNSGGGLFRQGMTMSQRALESDLRTNLVSLFLCTKAVGNAMLEQKSGSIVNISSRESQMPALGMAGYGAAKAGVNSLTRTLAWELGPHVRINAILPGPVLTPTNMEQLGPVHDRIVEAIPLKRTGTPEDIALAALYLASPASSWVTGKLFEIDGGIEFSYLAHGEMARGVS